MVRAMLWASALVASMPSAARMTAPRGRHRLRSLPGHVNGAAIDGAPLEPFVWLAALHRDPREVVTRVQHFDDGLNVPHLVAQFVVPLAVLKYLPA